jgi:hypothetical protein
LEFAAVTDNIGISVAVGELMDKNGTVEVIWSVELKLKVGELFGRYVSVEVDEKRIDLQPTKTARANRIPIEVNRIILFIFYFFPAAIHADISAFIAEIACRMAV